MISTLTYIAKCKKYLYRMVGTISGESDMVSITVANN